MNRRSPHSRREAGFSFVEILVVIGIIVVLMSMVVVLVPMIQENGRRTKSMDNVKTICQYLQSEAKIEVGKWPQFNGKNFILSLVATNTLNRANMDNMAILFSPGDGNYTLGAVSKKDYEAVTLEALKTEGHTEFLKLTSYAGRRNREKGHKLTAKALEEGSLIVCDDDDGALHHSQGMVMGYTSGNAKFVKWSDLGISPPADPDNPVDLLGDNAPTTNNGEELKHMSSGN
jgi:type II secretory pathway pseudopilin PulG